jgi:hypothetical protein
MVWGGITERYMILLEAVSNQFAKIACGILFQIWTNAGRIFAKATS